jgi:hypothetical protein
MPITSISNAITATESGRRSANLTSAIMRVPYLWDLLRIEEAAKVQSAVPAGTPNAIIMKAREARLSVASHRITPA